jgi:uncharacterized membrane protein
MNIKDTLHLSSLRNRDPHPPTSESGTFGQRVADKVAAFGGSWPFIGLFLALMMAWMYVNTNAEKPADPYPFILLNLVLSCLAALQAPIIMMSQNRQAARDRIDAQHDYEVNLIAEEQVLEIHRKLDELRATQVAELLELQRRQMEILELLGRREGAR